jgi:TP901 family phage tail tape measure protein
VSKRRTAKAIRALFSILKEMQASFEKNNLGTGQRRIHENHFRRGGKFICSVLMAAAASGKLDQLTATLKASDGKTEELVKVMQDNLGGDFKEFQSAYEAVGTDLYDQQDSSLRKLTQTATQYVLKLDGWIKKNKGWRNYRHHCRWRTGSDWYHRRHWSRCVAGCHGD